MGGDSPGDTESGEAAAPVQTGPSAAAAAATATATAAAATTAGQEKYWCLCTAAQCRVGLELGASTTAAA